MRHEDGVGPRVGALLAAGGAEQEGERQEPACPHARGEKVKPVNGDRERRGRRHRGGVARRRDRDEGSGAEQRSEEHTSELQSLAYLVCRLLLEKKKKNKRAHITRRTRH